MEENVKDDRRIWALIREIDEVKKRSLLPPGQQEMSKARRCKLARRLMYLLDDAKGVMTESELFSHLGTTAEEYHTQCSPKYGDATIVEFVRSRDAKLDNLRERCLDTLDPNRVKIGTSRSSGRAISFLSNAEQGAGAELSIDRCISLLEELRKIQDEAK
ncbi:MAG: hypothetical protein HZB70_01015 [Candidatus Berkelbacteria bacterium]|nr:MAG: hypothetical protein HZB70_01015 [Candidatus Berkelbacteria bacterium]QQG52080.1 MAG: hypothetical protein HY845_01980 [Candidatus Berkelbacteria bacterium]